MEMISTYSILTTNLAACEAKLAKAKRATETTADERARLMAERKRIREEINKAFVDAPI